MTASSSPMTAARIASMSSFGASADSSPAGGMGAAGVAWASIRAASYAVDRAFQVLWTPEPEQRPLRVLEDRHVPGTSDLAGDVGRQRRRRFEDDIRVCAARKQRRQ